MKFKRSYKDKADLLGSEKLQKYVFKTLQPGSADFSKGAKKKWKVLLKDEPRTDLVTGQPVALSKGRGSEGLSRVFKLRWVARQSLKEHFKIRTRSGWRRSINSFKFLELYEKRVDTLLWKSKIASSLEQARQWVAQGLVYKFRSAFPGEGTVVLRASDRLQVGNWLSVKLSKKGEVAWKGALLKKFSDTQVIRRLPIPFHIEVHYATLSLILAEEPDVKKIVYPYNVNWEYL